MIEEYRPAANSAIEYNVIRFYNQHDIGILYTKLNTLAEDGWRIIDVSSLTGTTAMSGCFLYTLERERR